MENQVINYTTLSTSTKPKPSKLRIFFVILLSVVLIAVIVFSILVERSSDFTEAEHVARVTALAKKRYLGNDEKYTDLQVYPIYDQDDKLQYFLIEFEPVGYAFVCLHNTNIFSSMYTRATDTNMFWARYEVEIGSRACIQDTYSQKHVDYFDARLTEFDENGEPIIYYRSPYKVANVLNEKLYLLKVVQRGHHGEMVAVKRNGRYLNLISIEYMDYKYQIDEILWPIYNDYFVNEPNHYLDL